MKKTRLLQTLITLPFFLLAAMPVSAYSVPDFGSCLNPQGSLIVSYSSGSHGVAGSTQSYQGADAVYRVAGNAATQCLCPDTGEGIQTNWLETSGLSQDEISILENQGWMYIGTGSSWGLSDIPYLVQNSNYSCNGATPTPTPETSCTPTPTVTTTPTLGPTSTPTPGPTSTPTPGPAATATPTPGTTRVAGLAYTGNMLLIYVLLGTGAASFILGLILKKFSK